MENVKVLGHWSSPFYYRVRWGLGLKGIKYEHIEEDLANKSSMLLEYNPVHKKVPVLVHNEKPVCESLIILEYLEEACPGVHPLLPKDPYQRAQARFWAKFAEDKGVAFWTFFLATEEEQPKAKADCLDILTNIEEHCLAGRTRFIGGEIIGIADIVLGSMIYWLNALEDVMQVKIFESSSFPSLYKWFNNFMEDPVIKNHVPDKDHMFIHFSNLRQKLMEAKAE